MEYEAIQIEKTDAITCNADSPMNEETRNIFVNDEKCNDSSRLSITTSENIVVDNPNNAESASATENTVPLEYATLFEITIFV